MNTFLWHFALSFKFENFLCLKSLIQFVQMDVCCKRLIRNTAIGWVVLMFYRWSQVLFDSIIIPYFGKRLFCLFIMRFNYSYFLRCCIVCFLFACVYLLVLERTLFLVLSRDWLRSSYRSLLGWATDCAELAIRLIVDCLMNKVLVITNDCLEFGFTRPPSFFVTPGCNSVVYSRRIIWAAAWTTFDLCQSERPSLNRIGICSVYSGALLVWMVVDGLFFVIF